MKKIFFSMLIFAGCLSFMTSCGHGSSNDSSVNTDSVPSVELLDSLSMAMGASDGASAIRQYPESFKTQENLEDYLKGFQLILGTEFTLAELQGMQDALMIAKMFNQNKALGVDLNRELYMKEFRKYFQKTDLSMDQLSDLYSEVKKYGTRVDEILKIRELMRNSSPVEQVTTNDNTSGNNEIEIVEETQVTEEEVAAPQPTNPTDNTQIDESTGLPM